MAMACRLQSTPSDSTDFASVRILLHAPLCPQHTVCMGSRPQCSLAVRSRSSSAISTDMPGIKLSGVHSGFWSLQRNSRSAEATAIWRMSRRLNGHLISSEPLFHVKRFSNRMLSGYSQAILFRKREEAVEHSKHTVWVSSRVHTL